MAAIIGTCVDMCPPDERRWRVKHNLLHPLEQVKAECPGDKKRMVKQFKRSAAGQKQATSRDIRPPQVLRKTMQYLIEEIIPRTDMPWTVIYDFVFDRLRAIRQDMFVQQVESKCIDIFENAIRFYVYSSYRLCEETKAFDLHINNVHLQECLKRLLLLYQEADCDSMNRSELESLYLLHNLDSSEALHHYCSLPKWLRKDPVVKRSALMQIAFIDRNCVRFFKLMKELSVLEMCCVHQHLQKVRQRSLQALNIAFSSKNCQFPVEILVKWLCLSDVKQVEIICSHYGLKVTEGKVLFLKSSWKSDASLFPSHREEVIDKAIENVSLQTLFSI